MATGDALSLPALHDGGREGSEIGEMLMANGRAGVGLPAQWMPLESAFDLSWIRSDPIRGLSQGQRHERAAIKTECMPAPPAMP